MTMPTRGVFVGVLEVGKHLHIARTHRTHWTQTTPRGSHHRPFSKWWWDTPRRTRNSACRFEENALDLQSPKVDVAQDGPMRLKICRAKKVAVRCPSHLRKIKSTLSTLHFKPSKRTALSFKIPGITSGLNPATSKSFIQRSGVMSG